MPFNSPRLTTAQTFRLVSGATITQFTIDCFLGKPAPALSALNVLASGATSFLTLSNIVTSEEPLKAALLIASRHAVNSIAIGSFHLLYYSTNNSLPTAFLHTAGITLYNFSSLILWLDLYTDCSTSFLSKFLEAVMYTTLSTGLIYSVQGMAGLAATYTSKVVDMVAEIIAERVAQKIKEEPSSIIKQPTTRDRAPLAHER